MISRRTARMPRHDDELRHNDSCPRAPGQRADGIHVLNSDYHRLIYTVLRQAWGDAYRSTAAADKGGLNRRLIEPEARRLAVTALCGPVALDAQYGKP